MHDHLLLLVCLVPLFVIGLVILAVAVATASAEIRHKRYLAGGIDMVDADMTQEQFGQYLMCYFENRGYTVSVVSLSEAEGFSFIAGRNGQQRFVFAKRSRNGVPDQQVLQALAEAAASQLKDITIVTNSVLSRTMDERVKSQGVKVWDRELIIPYLGRANARRFAEEAIKKYPVSG